MTIEINYQKNSDDHGYCVVRDGRGGVIRINNDELRLLADLIDFKATRGS